MDKVIVIIGATSGFGLAMVEKFSKESAKLILVARSEEKLTETIAASSCHLSRTMMELGQAAGEAILRILKI